MPVENCVGTSDATRTKQENFKTIMQTHVRIVDQIFKKRNYQIPYHFYDITAGRGINPDGEFGSPKIFIDIIEKIGTPYKAFFIEQVKDNYDSLVDLFAHNKNVKIYNGDHKDVLPQLIPDDPRWRYGMIYSDLNGIFNAELLGAISHQPCFHSLDVLINCPASAIKRTRSADNKSDKRLLGERLAVINKSDWLIRDSLAKWQWTFLLGTNWDAFPQFSKINMYRMDSKRGEQIFDRLNHTKKELENKNMPNLFFPKYTRYNEYLQSQEFSVIRKQVFQRSGGVCELCKINCATEPHHKIYPDWYNGEIDVPSNLIAVCHRCHCKLHNKEN